jgi:hypothetical protein
MAIRKPGTASAVVAGRGWHEGSKNAHTDTSKVPLFYVCGIMVSANCISENCKLMNLDKKGHTFLS